MTRRLLGPIGGPIAFLLIGALVFSGLAWLTYTALRVEESQRESAARADLTKSLREALWRLDGRMIQPLGGEDTRPYIHYVPPDPAYTPLLAQDLPDWMKLHFHLDPASGWCSPQVLPPETASYVRTAWADRPPQNLSVYRCAALDDIKERYPAGDTVDAFTATCRAIPDDAVALAPPASGSVSPVPQPVLSANSLTQVPSGPAPTLPPSPIFNNVQSAVNPDDSENFRLFGWDFCPRGLTQQATNDSLRQNSLDVGQAGGIARGNQSQVPGVSSRGGRVGNNSKDSDNSTQAAEGGKRVQILDRSQREAKQAAEHLLPKGQLQNYGQWFDPRMAGNSAYLNLNPGNRLDNNTTTPVTGPGGNGSPTMGSEKDNKENPAPGADAEKAEDAMKTRAAEQEKFDWLLSCERDLYKKLPPQSFAESLESLNWNERLDNNRVRRSALEDGKHRAMPAASDEQKKLPEVDRLPVPPIMPVPAPQMEPMVPWLPAPLPFAVHLGSMRPQWVTAPDGSEMLVLVRPARVDNKTVFQGVVLDWPKLEASLKEEVRDLFPEANLTAVKDAASAPPDRTMTTLPIQLDPGPEHALAPAGWTTLRIGLLLAWLAAIIAFAAVGFAGWSLIDLAERRFRFVSAVTHELRTPLTSLRLYLDLLVSGMIQDEAKRQEYLSTLAVESDRLHRLIDNVLDFAKLEKRKKNGDMQPVKITDLLDQLRQTWTDRAAVDGKELVVISTLPSDLKVTTDPAMIQQIVGNLIDNARKYSREAIDKRIWVWAKPGPGNSVVIEVEDRGTGVPAGERKSIFKPFRRGDAADSKAGGAGLGLALARSWAEVLGANLTYRPADGGVGACFRLELPGQ